MQPVFLDLHIHTSTNPDSPNTNFDLHKLKENIEKITSGSPYLISLTDHNFINKKTYMKAVEIIDHLLIGVELHIRNYKSCRPYHCHLIFNIYEITEEAIDNINKILDRLYPKKTVSNDDDIPSLEDIMNAFEGYEVLVLPHGGQNHSTFDQSIPSDVKFDSTMERNIYYNHFDGFTARGTSGLDRTHSYFDRLGIKDFINLVTATDNYSPNSYPECNAGKDASDFIPTWMLSSPTFNGLRLSLSESSRLVYGEKPDSWAEYIKSVSLNNEAININVTLTPGLNVVIGGSSSGKSLLVDSMYHKIINNTNKSIYANTPYKIQEIEVENPSGQYPHYLNQNYIMQICDQRYKKHNIDDISILKSVFPPDDDERDKINNALEDLRLTLNLLINAVTEIESLQNSISRIPSLARLIITEKKIENPISNLLPDDNDIISIEYSSAHFERHGKVLDEIDSLLTKNPLVKHDHGLVKALKDEMFKAFQGAVLEEQVRDIITKCKSKFDDAQTKENQKVRSNRKEFDTLLKSIKKYLKYTKQFKDSLEKIATFTISISTKNIESMGHKLYIKNEFKLTKEIFLEVVNDAFRIGDQIQSFNNITPELLFKSRFKQKDPKITSYPEFENYVNSRFADMNKKTYKIITSDNRDFDLLSAGWKTSIILDLVLGWEEDTAPIIIDQPEDNLATSYINTGLISAIKRCKTKKQIILVSHNATIPMLGDAQNIIMCSNEGNIITISSNPLEGSISGKNVVDLIAEVTDGGKSSIKKRFKKYNLKDFKGDS